MANYNVRLKKKNKNAWDVLYPESLAGNIKTTDGTDVQEFIDTVFNKTATTSNNGMLSKEDKAKLNGIESNANNYVHPNNESTRHVTDEQIAGWGDKYTKIEIDNKLNELSMGLDWKESVETFDDIITAYPNPKDGWTVNVNDMDITYRYTGAAWTPISANAIPLASQYADGKMSKEDKVILDKLLPKVDNLAKDLDSISKGVSGDFRDVLTRISEAETVIRQNSGSIDDLDSRKSNNDHTHDTRYACLDHNHNEYAPISHSHEDDYLSKNGGEIFGDLSVKSDRPLMSLKTGEGKVIGSLTVDSNGALVIAPGESQEICLRPNGVNEVEGQMVINEDGARINDFEVSVDGHGNHVPELQVADNTMFLRNDNTWQQITPAKIGAAEETHEHDFHTLTGKPIGLAGQVYYLINDRSEDVAPGYILVLGYFAETEAELYHAKANAKTSSDSVIYDLINESAWIHDGANWVIDNSLKLMDDIGAGKILFDQLTEKLFFTKNREEILCIHRPVRSLNGSAIQQDSAHRFVSDSEKSVWNGKASTAIATGTANGLMSKEDKIKLDSIHMNQGAGTTRKFTALLGDGVETSFAFEHDLGEDIVVSVRDMGSYEFVYPDIQAEDGVVILRFAEAPYEGQFKVVVIG